MNFLGIGPLELVLIIVLALIFLGPDELPVVMRKLATFLKELQELSSEVSSQLREEFGPELEEISRATSELQDATKTVHKAQEFVRNPVRAVSVETSQALTSTPSAGEEHATDEEESPSPQSEDARPAPSSRPLIPPQETPDVLPDSMPPHEEASSSPIEEVRTQQAEKEDGK